MEPVSWTVGAIPWKPYQPPRNTELGGTEDARADRLERACPPPNAHCPSSVTNHLTTRSVNMLERTARAYHLTAGEGTPMAWFTAMFTKASDEQIGLMEY